jgi:predicted dehydrogenase
MTHTVAIIGLGNIGMMYDQHLSANDFVLSHARAFHLHSGFEMVRAVDPDPQLRDLFAKTYNFAAHSTIEDALAHTEPHVMVVASPTHTHSQIVDKILANYRPLAILCEKPLANEGAAAQAIVDACLDKQVPLYVNFTRRADPGVREVRARLQSGQIAMPFKAIVWYSKGLLHNGSHFADLLSFWFGPILAAKLITSGRAWADHDSEPDFQITFEGGSAIFCAAQEENFSHYTVEVVAANGRLRYEQGGAITWQAAVPHATLAGYRQLQSQPDLIKNDMNRYQYQVAEQLDRALNGATHTLCTGACAAETHVWLQSLIIEPTDSKERHE